MVRLLKCANIYISQKVTKDFTEVCFSFFSISNFVQRARAPFVFRPGARARMLDKCHTLNFPAGTAASLLFNAPSQALARGSYEGFKILCAIIPVILAALLCLVPFHCV